MRHKRKYRKGIPVTIEFPSRAIQSETESWMHFEVNRRM